MTVTTNSSVASSGAGVVAGGGGTKGGCGRCGQAFSIFFNKRVQCGGGCGLPVCRKCAPWSAAAQTYVCGVCSTQQPQSTTHAATTTPKTPDDAHLRQVEDSVRSHIEALVESQVGGPLDQVTAAPSTTQPHQRSLFNRHHGALSQAIAHLSYSLQMSILNRPLPTEDLPTSRHTQLSDQLTHAIKDAMILPRQMEGYDPAVSPETPVEDFNSHTYEDILATAILNKVLESCEGGRPNEVTIEVSHDVTSTDTDSGMSGGAKESRRGRHKRSEVSEAGSEGSEERSLTPPRHPAHRPTTISPDQGVVTDDCWANAVTTEGAPLQFKIEEHVEEITTHHLTDDDQDQEIYDEDVSDSGGSWRGSRCSLDDSRERRHHKVSHHSVTEDPLLSTINVALPDPAHITSRRVSFPELGADIIHDSYADADECEAGPGDMVVDSETWEENWLFRRQRLVGAAGSDPVTMLIPNPEAHVPATVGNRDVDELSELSEQQSFGSGEPWSDSEGEGEAGESYQPSTASRELSTLAGEIVAEFAQQDQEYTVDYSVPSRVTTASTTQEGGRKHSPTQPSPTQSHKSSTMPQSVHYLYTSHKEVPTGYHDGKTVEGIRNPVIVGKPRVDPDTISDSERPVPKPRKLSLATTPPSKTSMKSPLQLLPSPAEDLTILSPPLDMPHPKNVSSTSETVWFVETPEDCTVMQGRTLRLACQVNTKKPMGLSWYHNGSLVPVNHRDYWVFRRGSHHHLHVYGMTPSAAGVYAAAAYTTTHCVWVFCRVQHKANSRPQKRPTFTKGLSDITLEEGGELNLQCQVQGHPEPRVIFSRGLVKLEPSSRLAVESDQYGTWTLRLAECTLADSGEITATAFNMMSTITTRCHVRIVPEGTPIPQQDRTDTGRLKPSSSQQDPRPGGRHNRKKHNPGSYPSNTTRPTSGNLLTSAKTSSLPHRDQLTTSSGVNTDVDDLDDIQQVPTRPGITQEDVFSSTYGPAVDNEHVLSHDQTTVDEDSDLNSSVLLDGGRAYKCKVLGMDKSLEPIKYGETIDNSTTDGGNSADAYALLFKDASASLEYLAEDISNPSSPLCEEFPNLASNGLISPSSSPCGASLGLDYYPSSHDDNPSDKEELPVKMSSVLSYSSSSTAIGQRVNIDPSVNISPLFPLTTDQLHAYTTLRDQHQEHEECPQGDKHDPACLLTASRPPTGTIADREHRKWEAAVSLPNNPYAPERLVQRLSLCHTSDHTPQPRRTLSVEFPEEGEKEEVDPSLRDGVPPKTDLNRYSRDYYVTPATGVRASSKSFKHQKSQQQQHQEPQAHQQKKQHQQQQPGHQQQSYKTHQHLTLNGHQAVTRTSSDFSSNAQIHIIGGGLQNTNKSNSEATLHCLRKAEVESSRPSDWKDELRDIQAAHVEQEVAKFQQTIDETQRRWEENYARVVPRSTHTNGQSDSSTEVLHNPHVDAYLVPPRHDLWRTVSEDTIAAQPRDRTVLQPFLRHTSVDNLQPSTKVSNLRNLGSLPQQNMNSMNSVSSMSNININSVTGLGKSANYQHQTHYNRSMESMSTYSDGESQGEGIDSDASTRTPDEMPVLPSVRKLACKFDQASQERVNDLDKRGKDNALSYYGKKNILLIEKSTFSDQPYTRSFTNNLNKRTEKPYIVKEVRPLPGGEDSHPATVTDTYDSDIDSSDFDDQATVTSLSLPPTPASLNDKHSFSIPSLIDTDSCYSVDDRDPDQTTSCDQFGNKIIFGVTLRRTNTSPTNSADSRRHASVSCISSVEGQINYRNRRLSSTSTVDLEREVTPSDSDSDAPNALRQSTIIKLHHGSNLDLSHQDSNNLRHQKKYYSSLDLSSVSKSTETNASEASLETNKARAIKQTVLSNWPLNRQISLPNVYTLSGPAFVPKGRRRMCDFLNSYSGHKSLHEMNPIDEKIEEDLRNQKQNDKHKQQRYSVPVQPKESLNKKSTFKKSKSEGSLKAPNKDTTDSSLLQDNTCRDTQVWQMGARNTSVSTINDVSSKLPKHAKTVSDSATTENSLQTSRNNLTPSSFTNDLATSPVNDSQEVVLNSEDEELPYASLNLLPQTFSTNVADDDASSHTSDGTYTAPVTQTMEGDQLKIKLNENHVSLFQSNLEEDSQTPTGSIIEIPDFRDQPVKINKVIKKKSASNTTGVHPLRKQRSIGDLLKEYSNLKSLDEKSAFRNVKVIPNVTKTESNKTIITISDDEMKLQPKIQIIAKSKDSTWVTPPTTWAAVNTKLSPVTSKHNKSLTIVNYKEPAEHLEDANSKGTNDGNENVKTMKPIDKEPTEDLWDEIQTARNMSPNNKIPDSAGTSTVISVPDTEALLSNATPVFHASIVYVGNDVKDNHDDSSRSNIYDKVSSINKDINGNMNIVNAPIKQSSPECSLGDITVNGLRAETKITSPSIQSEFVRGPGSPITDTSCTSPELEQKDVHIVKEDSNEMPSTKGPHVTVISVTEAPDNPSPSHKHNVTSSSPGNSSDEDIPFDDPIALTRMIVSSSRAGSSNKQRAAKRQNIKKATVPLNSPFSPIRQKAKHPVNVTKTSIIEVGPIKKQLGPRDSYDEGVHSQFSDMEMAPSATSLESKSTSSLDIVGEEGREPMV